MATSSFKLEEAEKFRKDYKPPPFRTVHTFLELGLDFDCTAVCSDLFLLDAEKGGDLALDGGPDMDLSAVYVARCPLADVEKFAPDFWPAVAAPALSREQYSLTAEDKLLLPRAVIDAAGAAATPSCIHVRTVHRVFPSKNLELQGLYRTNDILCTQCEPEGFRRITYSIDRPDVLSKYSVRLTAPKTVFPVLLSNGNVVAAGDLGDGAGVGPGAAGAGDGAASSAATAGAAASASMGAAGSAAGAANGLHFAHFHDPHPKPSYLFAVVAGDLARLHRQYVTGLSQRLVDVSIWCAQRHKAKLEWAMESLVRAMRWDETEFGLEYDLSAFHLVAVNDFNQGAMENKGLNIFNASCLLASAETATDADHYAVLATVAHEYFHNWTGNRVTLRDWFQLTLKEGLTDLREALFSQSQRVTARVDAVHSLRAAQFPEDAGPLAHPIRPESYVVMDNFYTSTVYDKGSEVCRLFRTLLGRKNFRTGLRHYLAKFDGRAATCDDFREAVMAGGAAAWPATERDAVCAQLEEWYRQPGTPQLTVVSHSWDRAAKVVRIALRQEVPARPDDAPLPIPVAVAAVGRESHADLGDGPQLLLLREKAQTFELRGIGEPYVLSVLRDFSAPVRLVFPQQTVEDLAFLAMYDTDGFIRVDSAQAVLLKCLAGTPEPAPERAPEPAPQAQAPQAAAPHAATPEVGAQGAAAPAAAAASSDAAAAAAAAAAAVSIFRVILSRWEREPGLIAEQLLLPPQALVEQELPAGTVDPVALASRRRELRALLARSLEAEFRACHAAVSARIAAAGGEFRVDDENSGLRALRNACVAFLAVKDRSLAEKHWRDARNFNDRLAGAAVLTQLGGEADTPASPDAAAAAVADMRSRAQSDDTLVEPWLRLVARTAAPSVFADIAAAEADPLFARTNPNCIRALYGSFATGNPEFFHQRDGRGYELVARAVSDAAAFNGNSAATLLARAFGTYKIYAPDRAAAMRAHVERILADCTSDNVREVASRLLKE